MSTQRMFGIVLLVAGVALLIAGMNASHSFADQVSNTFTGRLTHETAWYIYGGLACAVAGVCSMAFGVRGKGA